MKKLTRSTRMYIASVAHSEAQGTNRKQRRANAAKTAAVLRRVVKSGKIEQPTRSNGHTI